MNAVHNAQKNRSTGREGEQLAAEYLAHQGLKIIMRNYRYDRGEIDLVCADGNELVFVEVKTRSSDVFGNPEESVTESKQEQLRKLAEGYCQEFHLDDTIYRFDIVTVRKKEGTRIVEHLKDAF